MTPKDSGQDRRGGSSVVRLPVSRSRSGTTPPSAAGAQLATARILDMAEARRRRAPARKAPGRDRRWLLAAAGTALLVLAVAGVAQWLADRSTISDAGPVLAGGALAARLNGMLSDPAGAAAPRMLFTFRSADGVYCRAYRGVEADGIACRLGAYWRVVRSQSHMPGDADLSRADTVAAALAMAGGAPLTPAVERAVQARGWRD